MGTTSSAIFNGTSRYSQDFQAIIDRATAIASLPISQLNNDKAKLTDQTTALTGLDSKFSALETAVEGIQQALGGSSFEATISDPSKVSATLGDGAMEGNYSIEILNAGAYATSMTTASWVATANPPGQKHTYQLSLGGVQYDVTPDDNSAATVASAINAQYGDKVRAMVVNVRTSDDPDYRISLQSTQLGDLAPDILDGGTSLQSQQTTGAQAHYIVNGSGQEVLSSSRSVAISDGLTLNLLGSDPGNPVNITVTRSSSALTDALSAFATAYNSAVDEVDKQHGQAAGALAGQSLVLSLSEVLRGLGTYSSPGSSIGGLADLGLELGTDGHLTFNPFTLLAAGISNSAGVSAFFGSSSTGGFLKWAADSLDGVEQAGTGLLPSAEASVTSQSTNLDQTIADQQARVDRMKEQMQEQMAAADALIAAMEQQYTYITNLFQAMQTADNQYTSGV
jgi:flagellar hook-associated protein 2